MYLWYINSLNACISIKISRLALERNRFVSRFFLRWKNCPARLSSSADFFTSKSLNFREVWLCSLCQPLWLGNPRPLTPSWKVAVDQVWRAIDTDNQSFVAFSLPLPDTIFTSHAERNKIISTKSSISRKEGIFDILSRSLKDIIGNVESIWSNLIQFPKIEIEYISKKRKKRKKEREKKYQRFEKFRIILD